MHTFPLSSAGPCRTAHAQLLGAAGYSPALFTNVAQNYTVPHRPGAIDTRVAKHLAGAIPEFILVPLNTSTPTRLQRRPFCTLRITARAASDSLSTAWGCAPAVYRKAVVCTTVEVLGSVCVHLSLPHWRACCRTPACTCCSGVRRPRGACDRDRRAAEAGAAPCARPPAAGGRGLRC
jgi:hypothetical protein